MSVVNLPAWPQCFRRTWNLARRVPVRRVSGFAGLGFRVFGLGVVGDRGEAGVAGSLALTLSLSLSLSLVANGPW